MIKAILFIIFFCLNVKATCIEQEIVCKTVCYQDGDESGFLINNKCYCANYRDLSKIILRVPKNGGTIVEKKKPSYLEY